MQRDICDKFILRIVLICRTLLKYMLHAALYIAVAYWIAFLSWLQIFEAWSIRLWAILHGDVYVLVGVFFCGTWETVWICLCKSKRWQDWCSGKKRNLFTGIRMWAWQMENTWTGERKTPDKVKNREPLTALCFIMNRVLRGGFPA